MSCYNPLRAFQVGYHPSGKPRYKITSYDVDYVYRKGDAWYSATGDVFLGSNCDQVVRDSMLIPCGNCIGCRLDYAREWANRCALELRYHDEAYFVTLTYDDEHVPITAYGDPETGEAIPAFTLRKRDLQLFWKRLRKAYPDCHLRYFACGEYGTDSFRPHYHAIIYGLHLDDLHVYKKNFHGDTLYNCARLERVWSDSQGQIGHVVVGSVTWDSCCYVARYILKKHKGDEAQIYDTFNIEPEFVVMSRKPGIGYQYLVDNYDRILYNQSISIATESKGLTFNVPRYFDRLFENDAPDQMEIVRAHRKKFAQNRTEQILQSIGVPYQEYLRICRENKLAVTRILQQRMRVGDE